MNIFLLENGKLAKMESIESGKCREIYRPSQSY